MVYRIVIPFQTLQGSRVACQGSEAIMTLERAKLYKTALLNAPGEIPHYVQTRFPEQMADGSIRFQCHGPSGQYLGYYSEDQLTDFCL